MQHDQEKQLQQDKESLECGSCTETKEPSLNSSAFSWNKTNLYSLLKEKGSISTTQDIQQLLSLITFYDDEIKELTHKLQQSEKQVEVQRVFSSKVQDENINLYQELDSLLTRWSEERLNATAVSSVPVEGGAEWSLLIQKVKVVEDENQILAEQNEAYKNELQRLRGDLTTKTTELYESLAASSKNGSELEQLRKKHQLLSTSSKQQMEQIRANESLKKEWEDNKKAYQAQIDSLMSSVSPLTKENEELKRNIQTITTHYEAALVETEKTCEREKEVMATLKGLEVEYSEIRNKYSNLSKEYTFLKRDHVDLKELSQSLETRLIQVDEKEKNLFKQKNEMQKKVEDIQLEYQKALVREQNQLKEIERLQQHLKQITESQRKKYEEEMEAMRYQFDGIKQNLLQESLEMEKVCAEAKSNMERAIREKRSVEEELEKVIHYQPNEVERLNHHIHDLSVRLRLAESDREQTFQLYENAKMKSQREESKYQTELKQLSKRNEEIEKRLRKLEREQEELMEEKLKLVTQVCDMEHQIHVEKDTKMKILMDHEQDMTNSKKHFEKMLKETKERWQEALENYEMVRSQVQKLLEEEELLKSKWKQQVKLMQSSFQQSMTTLEQQLKEEQQRSQVVTLQLSELEEIQKGLHEDMDFIKQEKESFRKLLTFTMEERDQGQERIKSMVEKQNALHLERRHLEREVESLKTKLKKQQTCLSEKEVVKGCQYWSSRYTPPLEFENDIATMEPTFLNSKLAQDIQNIKERIKRKSKKV